MPERWTPSLEDFVDIASFVLDAAPEAIRRLPGLALADSAIHAPFASFEGADRYATLVEQAAGLIEHLARNHPLPDGNKRTAFLLTARFLDANGLVWGSSAVEIDAPMVERIAAGDAAHHEIVDWIRSRTAQA